MSKYGIDPSWKQGFAPRDGPSANPGLLDGLVYDGIPAFGQTGLTLFDVSGRSNNGINNGPTWVAGDPKSGGPALNYAAANTDMGSPSPSAVNFTGSYSVAGRINFDRADNFGSIIGNDQNQLGWMIASFTTPNGSILVYHQDSFILSNAAFTDDVWHSFAVVWNSPAQVIQFWIDGVDIGIDTTWTQGAKDPAVPDPSEHFAIGIDPRDLAGQDIEASISSLYCWDRVLVPNEIQHLHLDPLAPFRLADTPIAATVGAPAAGGRKQQIIGSGIIV